MVVVSDRVAIDRRPATLFPHSMHTARQSLAVSSCAQRSRYSSPLDEEVVGKLRDESIDAGKPPIAVGRTADVSGCVGRGNGWRLQPTRSM